MRVQATSFRLPALKLQPKESQFSLSYGDNNQSSSSMIKYQSSPLRNYDPSPIKKRVRGMTIAIYNSQEKLKTAEFRYGGDFITQQVNQSTSVVNTVRRYRSKLKQLMYQPPKEDGGLSRDPRIYSFKEPTATIRLDRLSNDRNDQQLQDKIKQLMTKVKLLLSTQQFYHEPQIQDTFQVSMVKLKDEYDCLYQDFNDYYVQNKKLDIHVQQLLNHMEIIKTLLKPKRPIITRKESLISFDDIPLPPSPKHIPEPEFSINTQQSQQQIEILQQQIPEIQITPQTEQPREPSIFTPLTSIQLNEEEQLSDLDQVDSNVPISPKKRRQKNKRSPQKSQKSIILQPSEKDLSNLDNQSVSKPLPSSRSKTKIEDIPLKSFRSTQSEQQQQSEQEQQSDTTPISERAPLKRTISNLGSMNKRRNTVLENKQNRRQIKGTSAISEQDDSQFDENEENLNQLEQSEKQIDQVPEEQQEYNYEDELLTKLIESENIYRYPFYQTWEYHIDRIIDERIFGQYDL